jgi:hypothetical protein
VEREFGQTKDLARGPSDPALRAQILALYAEGHAVGRVACSCAGRVAGLLRSAGIWGSATQPCGERFGTTATQ